MCVHINEDLFAQFCKLKVLSRRAILRSLGITSYQAIYLQASQNGVDIAFTDYKSFTLLEGLGHFIAVTLTVLKQVEDNNVQQALTKLSLPIIQIQN
jgi:hypothetical protein